MSAARGGVNIRRESCRRDHRTTCATGPYGTFGNEGDVRRCEHGRLWLYSHDEEGRFFNLIDVWTPLSPIWTPIRYRRAKAALRTIPEPDSPKEKP